jgi:hypothetical protein
MIAAAVHILEAEPRLNFVSVVLRALDTRKQTKLLKRIDIPRNRRREVGRRRTIFVNRPGPVEANSNTLDARVSSAFGGELDRPPFPRQCVPRTQA